MASAFSWSVATYGFPCSMMTLPWLSSAGVEASTHLLHPMTSCCPPSCCAPYCCPCTLRTAGPPPCCCPLTFHTAAHLRTLLLAPQTEHAAAAPTPYCCPTPTLLRPPYCCPPTLLLSPLTAARLPYCWPPYLWHRAEPGVGGGQLQQHATA
jgi:hypothetical protein